VRAAFACLALAALLCAGCGAERQKRADVRLEVDGPTRELRSTSAGLTLSLPKPYKVIRRDLPEVFNGLFDEASVAVWAYRRREQLPRTRSELEAARRRLVRTVKKRGGRYKLRRSRVERFAGVRAVDLLGDQTIASGRFRTRSLHLFKGKAEYVIEVLAPVAGFGDVESATVPVVERSLKVSGKVKRTRRKSG
jgi:hypothetical protein